MEGLVDGSQRTANADTRARDILVDQHTSSGIFLVVDWGHEKSFSLLTSNRCGFSRRGADG
jgi:hypothetical protein